MFLQDGRRMLRLFQTSEIELENPSPEIRDREVITGEAANLRTDRR